MPKEVPSYELCMVIKSLGFDGRGRVKSALCNKAIEILTEGIWENK